MIRFGSVLRTTEIDVLTKGYTIPLSKVNKDQFNTFVLYVGRKSKTN